MALRNIVKIDEEKCDGCGQCVSSCAEGAIAIVDSKARLVSDTYCDGLGACLGHCPQDAITVEQREAAEFDEEAAMAHVKANADKASPPSKPFVCPGSAMKTFKKPICESSSNCEADPAAASTSQLSHWPVQMKNCLPRATDSCV